jgi:hypothetical protein
VIAPSEARKRGSGEGSPRKHDDLYGFICFSCQCMSKEEWHRTCHREARKFDIKKLEAIIPTFYRNVNSTELKDALEALQLWLKNKDSTRCQSCGSAISSRLSVKHEKRYPRMDKFDENKCPL